VIGTDLELDVVDAARVWKAVASSPASVGFGDPPSLPLVESLLDPRRLLATTRPSLRELVWIEHYLRSVTPALIRKVTAIECPSATAWQIKGFRT
jgi:hypothetical protein